MTVHVELVYMCTYWIWPCNLYTKVGQFELYDLYTFHTKHVILSYVMLCYVMLCRGGADGCRCRAEGSRNEGHLQNFGRLWATSMAD